ncbi:hypothetical protein A3K73_05855 [Candidatus Pacearchaeota archaeon RBG_13_36_9]|nr:MAG: hypothetical protein A3K73_05855 [Candidatus Pacearchaeota archaeon RBG_13_36_9]
MDEEKFIQRVEMMLYDTCGCSFEEGIIILEKCLERAKRNIKEKRNFISDRLADPERKKRLKEVEDWANYIRAHKTEDWSKTQSRIIDAELKELKKD